MKKNLFYTVIFFLCGAISLSSCEDLLNVESNRVEYDFDEWTLNDSVFSVLGILKSVQEVGDRQVLLNELRADLVTLSKEKAVIDVQEISRSVFNLETNPYLDVKDYYAIINNCNIYLARVDTNLTKNNVKLMLPEYVAVKSVRAWTYLQLAINYNNVPYFTEPILSHSAAEKVMNTPMLSRSDIVEKLIAEIAPYENPSAYPMPAWDTDGKVLKIGYNGTEVETRRLFVPIRMLLGELYLWKGDYRNAAQCFYNQITGAGTNNTAKKYKDNTSTVTYSNDKGESINDNYSKLFAAKEFSNNTDRILAIIPYANNDLQGTISGLADIFSPQNDKGGAQVFASPAMISLAKQQIYRYHEGDVLNPTKVKYSHGFEYPGDLRLKATTYSQIGDDDDKTEYKNIIAKFNLEEKLKLNGLNSTNVPNIRTTYISLCRPEHAYLRFAEALVGLERNGYTGAMDLAMTVLKVGVKRNYSLLLDPEYSERNVLDENGEPLKKYTYDPITGAIIDTVYVTEKYLSNYADSLGFDFTDFKDNTGIHSRGTGDSERNIYYALTDECMARYFGYMQMIEGVETIVFPDGKTEFTHDDKLQYVTDLIIDELALELAWEGTRFGDLVRFAIATGDKDILAKRIAGREYSNDVTYRNVDFAYDPTLYSFMSDENNWYLPLPAGVVDPVDPDNIPGGTLPEDDETPGEGEDAGDDEPATDENTPADGEDTPAQGEEQE